MKRYILRRAGIGVLMLWVVSLLVFVVPRLLPGDPTIQKVGTSPSIDKDTVDQLRRSMGLDDPILVQYAHWIGGMFRGDLGESYFSQYSVVDLIGQRVAPTLLLAVGGVLVGVALAVPLALLPQLRGGRVWGRIVGAYTTLGMAAPPFVFGIAAIALFNVQFKVLPLEGYVSPLDDPVEALRALTMPAMTLAIAVSAPLIRYLRSSLTDTLTAPYVRTARGKGVRARVVLTGHVLPNALLPALTALGVIIGSVLGGVVIVEMVFRWPGLGSLLVDSVFKRDYAVVQSGVLLAAAAFLLVNLVVDILYGVLDPRLRGRGARA
ncbi:ABC transporter permease [Streptomyces boninensis]|uniref:ABC transporter permease n=1 Tax=Streptomyces boninensis TaxID=2039455 RepID=UPI003B20E0C0